MEFNQSQIAGLVLGYLKEEKVTSAYREFFKKSKHFKDRKVSKVKFLATRVAGLSLEDILHEYAQIWTIVQGHLEATSYYSDCSTRTTLVDQLIHLLNKIQYSGASTPCPRSPHESQIHDSSTGNDNTSDVETTPAHLLPGNLREYASEESYLLKTPKRKVQSKANKSAMENYPVTEKEQIPAGVLRQTLLENTELHEKLAETINIVRNTPEGLPSKTLEENIQAVVNKTVEIPIFDKILNELLETAVDMGVNMRDSEIMFNRPAGPSFAAPKSNSQSQTVQTEIQTVDEQNDEAIRSIMVASSSKTSTKQTSSDVTKKTSDVIVFDGSLDSYLKSSSVATTSTTTNPSYSNLIQNQSFANPGGLLMMQPSEHHASKPCNSVNNAPPLENSNLNVRKSLTVLTEDDIMAMPTIIVNDESECEVVEPVAVPAPVVVAQPAAKRVYKPRAPSYPKRNQKIRTIQPVPQIKVEVSTNPAEYLTIFSTKISNQESPKHIITTVVPTALTTNSSLPTTSYSGSFGNNAVSTHAGLLTTVDTLNKNISKTTTVVTKAQVTPSHKEVVAKGTPKSGSHIRNLDFSTPPKITSTNKKIAPDKDEKTPEFVHKKQAAKAKTADATDNETEGKCMELKKIDRGCWDADLRVLAAAAAASNQETKCNTPKRKRRSPSKKRRSPVKKKKNKKGASKVDVSNTTEEEALALEAALISPVKKSKKQPKKSKLKQDTIVPNEDVVMNDFGTEETEENTKNEPIKETSTITKSNNKKKQETMGKSKRKSLDSETTNKPGEEVKCKVVLSPSKFASKRTLVPETEPPLPTPVPEVPKNVEVDKNIGKMITPEMEKSNLSLPGTAKRNITPLLETPIKNDYIPKTPCIQSNFNASSSFTPFTKALEEHLDGIDINSIKTPNIPITPNFPPFTPTVDLISPYPNRGTDYSTSSSYYQPSDTEQNKSLEQLMIEECKRLERLPDSTSIQVISNIVVAKAHIDDKNQEKEINSEKSKNIDEHLKIFNRNVIGKKNLSLVKRDASSSSDSNSSMDSSSDSSSGTRSICNWNENQSNDTIICKKTPAEPTRSYPLRSRKPKPDPSTEITNQPSADVPDALEHKRSVPKKISAEQERILREMEEKRKRTINLMKNVKKTPTSPKPKLGVKRVMRNRGRNGRTLSIPVPKSPEKPPKNRRKSVSPRKAIQRKTEPVPSAMEILAAESTEEEFDLHISSDDDEIITPVNLKKNGPAVKSKLIAEEKKSSSDVEADRMITCLKERGIHLMHKKSPKKTVLEESEKKDKEVVAANPKNELIEKEDAKKACEANEKVEGEALGFHSETFEEENLKIVFDETKKTTKKFEDYDMTVLKRNLNAQVFVDALNTVMEVPIKWTSFTSLMEIPSKINVLIPKRYRKDVAPKLKVRETSKTREKSNKSKENEAKVQELNVCLTKSVDEASADAENKAADDLMNYAVVGSEREENSDDVATSSPKSNRKRKNNFEEDPQVEKKSKVVGQEILKQINVDIFLDKVHGEH